ncbi:hypothetical protein KCP74_21585 [Salmonella enterica subsp. enterica]|nr:hypothetical protein KCP74_21585 [Salmonella enterica subsp. enterica]
MARYGLPYHRIINGPDTTRKRRTAFRRQRQRIGDCPRRLTARQPDSDPWMKLRPRWDTESGNAFRPR